MGGSVMRGRPGLWALLLALAAWGAGAAPERREWQHGGRVREAWVSAPDGAATMVVLALHGGGGTARQMQGIDRGRLLALARRDRAVLAFPQGIDKSWNDGRGTRVIKAEVAGIDDVGFLRALVADLAAESEVPPGRVFVTGISNGGFMSLRLACEAADLVAAAAPVTATLSEAQAARCRPSLPVSLLLVNGTEDPLVPYRGGTVKVLGSRRGQVLSTAATVDRFVEGNGCRPEARVGDLPDRDPADGTRTRVHEWEGCRRGASVHLYEVRGGGHTWPGGWQYLPQALIGPVARDFEASEAIWEFFRTHGREAAGVSPKGLDPGSGPSRER